MMRTGSRDLVKREYLFDFIYVSYSHAAKTHLQSGWWTGEQHENSLRPGRSDFYNTVSRAWATAILAVSQSNFVENRNFKFEHYVDTVKVWYNIDLDSHRKTTVTSARGVVLVRENNRHARERLRHVPRDREVL